MTKTPAPMSVALTLVLAGCAQLPPVQPLTAERAIRLQGQSIAAIKAETPDFAAMTAAKGGFGLIGALAAISEGNTLVKANGIEDPAVRISAALKAYLADKYRLDTKPAPAEAVDDSIEQVTGAVSSADIALDVRTLGWRFGYFPANWGTYYVAYGARARLVDVKTKTVIAESTCATPRPEKTEKSPDYAALVDDGARGLKQELAVIADRCIGELKATMGL